MASLLRRSLALTVLTALPFTVQAAELYKVELLVFSHENSNGVEQEYWPSLPPLDLSASVYPQPWDGYPLANYEELPQNDLQLGGDAAALSRSAGYKLLYHRGWLQSIGSKASARGVRVKADFDQYQLDGMLKIYRNRFLHAQPTLELKTATPWQQAQPQPLPGAIDDAGIRVVTPLEESADGRQSWRMDQSRRMRSNETHYIDHPRFGVLLRIRALN